jgi:predicted house-cleaning noncanonical NTP pyrophosphatase (MazG superfamily)
MDIRKIHEPIDARPLDTGAVQKLYKFANNYGASVVKGEHTYGGEEGLWELAVIKFKTDGEYSLDYTTPITEDVEGHLTDDAVEELLTKIEALPIIALTNANNDAVHKLDNTLHKEKEA